MSFHRFPTVSPVQRKRFLLASSALTLGVVGSLVSSQPAMALCVTDVNVVNCQNTFNTSANTPSPITFTAVADSWEYNLNGAPNATNITVDTNGTGIAINAGTYDGTLTMDEGTSLLAPSGGGTRHGIQITGGDAVTATIGGSIDSDDSGADALRLNGADAEYSITVTSTGTLDAGTGGSGDALYVQSANSFSLTNHGTIVAGSGNAIHVDSTALATTINNYGTITGSIDFDDDAGAVTFNNYSPTTWNFTGTSNFTDESDLLNNEGGTIASSGTLATVLLRDGNDTLRNTVSATLAGGTANLNADVTTFFMSDGGDSLENIGVGSVFNANNATTFFFDDPDFFLFVVPIPGSESGAQFNDTFENRDGAVFNANDLTSFFFGGEDDVFRNSTGATFNAGGVTIFSFGSGNDEAYNTSLFNVDGVTTFTSVDFFNGTAMDGPGRISMIDGETDDLLNMGDPLFLSGPVNFVGANGNSTLGVDTYIGAEGDLDNDSDILWVDGTIAGSTAIVFNDTNTTAPIGTNTTGTDIVRYTDGTSIDNNCVGACGEGDAFYISSETEGYFSTGSGGVGGIERGLFASYLFQDDVPSDGAFKLVTLAGPGAVNAPGVITGAQNIFYDTLAVVEDHSYGYQFGGSGGSGADLPVEVPVYDAPVSSSGTQYGLWAKGTGSWTERDTSVTRDGIEFDTGSDQDTYSILGGADMKWSPDSPFRFGIFGGYVTSNLDFDLSDTSADYEGGVLGGYLAYNNGAFYADATVKGDWLNADYSFDGTSVDTDVFSVGIHGSTGYRFTMGRAFFEPLATVSYVHSEVDDFNDGGATVSFSDGDSLRAGAGARIGTTFAALGGTTELSLLGKVVNEFEDANEVSVDDGFGNSATFSDDISGLFGDVSVTATVTSADGSLSGFLSGGGKFGEDFTSLNAQVGVRKAF
jgi:hypothetical protein